MKRPNTKQTILILMIVFILLAIYGAEDIYVEKVGAFRAYVSIVFAFSLVALFPMAIYCLVKISNLVTKKSQNEQDVKSVKTISVFTLAVGILAFVMTLLDQENSEFFLTAGIIVLFGGVIIYIITDGVWKKERCAADTIYQQIDVDIIDDYDDSNHVSYVDGMDGHEFEHYCARVLEKNGFYDVSVTKGSGDQGVDVLATKGGIKYAIQCKNYMTALGNTPVQEVNAGKTFYNCHVGVVMTNSRFTVSAVELARVTGVLLWDRDVLQELISGTAKL